MNDETPLAYLVAVGSSAGGIDALSTLSAHLDAGFGAPVVVAQHLDPRRESHLDEIIRAKTKLPVVLVQETARLEPGSIYLIPPNAEPEIVDGEIRVTHHSGPGPAPSIDALFTSAARTYGEGAIAVILTGTGHDGTAGARDVKTAGGTVVIQNPDTAAYPGMPRAIPPTIVDIVAEIDAIGPLLHELVSGAYAPAKPDEERLLRTFLDQVRERSGIDFGSYKQATILRRLQRRMAATNTTRLRDYIRYVQANPDEYQRLTTAFLIKVTEFFRDADLFAYLRDTVVPQLILEARDRNNEIRFWSAGCATGEEAYSLAILVVDALGEELPQFNVRIFATDVDADAIAFARRGLYSASALTGVPADVVDRHFNRVGDQFEVKKDIRSITVFGHHDLGQRAPFPRVDLALCRNVLIYFTTELQKRALQLFAFSLRDGGYLVLGKAEATTPLSEYFVLEQPRLKVYRREGERVLIPPARIRDTTPLLPMRVTSPRRAGWSDPPGVRVQREVRAVTPAEKAETILLRLPIGVVVVNRAYDIQLINATARRLLAIHGPAIGDDLVHLVPESASNEIRRTLDQAFSGEPTSVQVDVPIPALDTSEVRSILVATHPGVEEDPGPIDSVVLIASDVTVGVRSRREMEEALTAERAERERILEQARTLTAVNAELEDANQQLATTNAELRSANEELLVANEEVQAATEEVETLNEELQATNEELETLNEELQATVEELNTTNDDLQARSAEIEDAAAALADQQRAAAGQERALAAILDSLGDAIVAVSATGEIVASNSAFRSVMPDPEVPLHDEGGRRIPAPRTPIARAANGDVIRMRVRPGSPEAPLYDVRSQQHPDGSDGVTVLVMRRVDD